jgi:peroxiredoxin
MWYLFRFVLAMLVLQVAIPANAADNAPDNKPSLEQSAKAVEDPKTPPPILPGHSMHGEAFDEGPRQEAYLMGGTGSVHFPVSTRSPVAQQFFDQGIGQLHGFWYFEAERSFRQVLKLDPECAMGYWGLAMANINNEKRAKAFIETAEKKKGQASAREALWIDALAESYRGKDNTDTRRKYVRELENLVQLDPDDVEARAFLVFRIWNNGSWMTESKRQLPISSHQAVDALLDQVFQLQPMHPAHHYRIHLWDEEKPARAIVSASLCGQSSPSIAHMWHMPGHTYSKLHRYADAAWQQEASARVDHAHMMRDRVLPDQIHNYAHNNEWLIRDWLHVGRVRDAMGLAKNMVDLPRHPKYNLASKKGTSAAFGLARLNDVLAQYECWAEIIELQGTRYVEPASGPDDQLKQARLLALAELGRGKAAEASRHVIKIEELLAAARQERYRKADEAETKARADKKSTKETTEQMAKALAAESDRVHRAEWVLAEVRAAQEIAVGKLEAAKLELAKLADAPLVSKEQLARAWSLAGDATQAETVARKAVESSPAEVCPLAVLVEVLHRGGKKKDAETEFAKLRVLAAQADLEYPVFARLAPIAAELGWPADWRITEPAPVDVGQRPPLDSLGPVRWEPGPAPSWTLPGADGKPASLADFHGKNVVVIFYLGSGCLHCVEQLQKFAPKASEFAAANVDIVAISSEPLETLSESVAKLSPKEPIPFRLAADPDRNVFKSYRAYDDFENMPLHATFLIDARGQVRWQDVSAEPFSDAAFLLEEAKRLLKN